MKTVILEDRPTFYGLEMGKLDRDNLKVMEEDSLQIVFSKCTYMVTRSFLRGFLEENIKRCSSLDEFHKNYTIHAPINLRESINSSISSIFFSSQFY